MALPPFDDDDEHLKPSVSIESMVGKRFAEEVIRRNGGDPSITPDELEELMERMLGERKEVEEETTNFIVNEGIVLHDDVWDFLELADPEVHIIKVSDPRMAVIQTVPTSVIEYDPHNMETEIKDVAYYHEYVPRMALEHQPQLVIDVIANLVRQQEDDINRQKSMD